jgi:hypothetical protein
MNRFNQKKSVIEESFMKKSLLLVVVAGAALAGSVPAFSQAQAPASGDGKMKTMGKKIGNGVMYVPRKVGAGMKKVGTGAKHMVHKDNK